MERIAMSQQERDQLDWLKRARERSISQREAAQKMGVSDRWVRKLLKRMVKQGDGVVVHGLRGSPSNRKLSAETQRQAVMFLKQPDWHDFGPTFASQQLAQRHGIEVSDETVWKWMMEAGLWKSKLQRVQEVHCWRARRSGFGELVQWDTSEHDWLEGRGPVRYLVRMIDDATSWSWGRFVEQDATPHNMGVLWEYLEKNGRMVDVYTDRDSMFTVPARAGESREAQRQADRLAGRGYGNWVGRALRELGNAHFARPVADFPNQHRALTPQLDLAAILCHVEERVIANDYTVSLAGQRYQIVRSATQAGMRHQRLRLELRLDGELKARYQGRYVEIAECGARVVAAEPKASKPVRKDHNAGGRSGWMQGFFDRPSPPLWKLLGD